MRKKIMSLCLVAALLAVAVTGATMAYFTDTEQAVNTMTMDNVEIRQVELQRSDAAGTLEPFVQLQPLYPAGPKADPADVYAPSEALAWGGYVTATPDASALLWDEDTLAGALDKFVFVHNIGAGPCYFRTWIGFECPEGMTVGRTTAADIVCNLNSGYVWNELGHVTVDGTRYYVIVGTYKQVLPGGKISDPSLLQVALNHSVTSAQNAALGGTYEILTFTQACQVTTFEDPDRTTSANAQNALESTFGLAVVEQSPLHLCFTPDAGQTP